MRDTQQTSVENATEADSTPPPAHVDDTPLLATRRFLPLFLVQALGAFNDNVFKNAFVALLTFRLALELEQQLGMDLQTFAPLAGGIFILPFALFAPFAGQIADSIDKAVMMRWVKGSEIVLMIGAAVAYHLQAIGPLLVLLFLMGAQSAFFAPIKYGALPQYLHRDELVTGNGLIQAATFVAILAGTIVGTNLVLTEAGITLVSAAVIGIALIGFVASLYAPPAPPSGEVPVLDWTLIPAMAKVLRRTLAVPRAWHAILAISWFWFAGSTFMIALAPFTLETLGGDQTVLTLLLASFSIGVAIGALLCSVVYRGVIKIGPSPWGAVGMAVFSLDLWFAAGTFTPVPGETMGWYAFLTEANGARVVFDFVALAACGGFYLTPLNAVYQDASPEAERGRIVACSNMIDALLMAGSAVFIIVLGKGLGLSLRDIFLIAGGSGIVVAFLVARVDGDTSLGRVARSFWPR